MRSILVSSIIAIFVLMMPSFSYAQSDFKETFKKNCVKTWMDNIGKNSDKVEYQNFGEKYCDCASGKPLESQADLEKTAQVCVAQILLHDTMDTLEDDLGINKLSPEQILSRCQNKWKMIFPEIPNGSENYCQCAAPKLDVLAKDSEKYTDKEWYEKMNAIAMECSGNVTPGKATSAQ